MDREDYLNELTAQFGDGTEIDEDEVLQGQEGDSSEDEIHEVDLSVEKLPEVTKRFEPSPHKFFDNPDYYKTVLAGEGEIAQRVHTLLQKYSSTKDPKDRSVFRSQLISVYWEFLRGVARKAPGRLPEPKKFLLRYSLLHPNLIDSETKNFFAKLVMENELNQPVYYTDEWFKAVGIGAIRPSTTDEVRIAQKNTQMKLQQLMEKAQGKLDGTRALLKAKNSERRDMEAVLRDHINIIMEHYPVESIEGVNSCYTDFQRRAFSDIQEALKSLLRSDHELSGLTREYYQAEADIRTLQNKVEEGGDDEILDLKTLDAEYDTIRQAAKMTIGRQGNHFPVLTNEYFRCGQNDVGYRENIIAMLARIESVDPEVFCRSYKNRLNRIVPYVILIPTYGDTGICWEPFDKHNRATSRGRIVIPMYPKNLNVAVLSAIADLRWQVAKEKASYHWMEEGLTGNYYQWFAAQKLKGDVKEYFIQDYIMWMTKEAEGIQKLEKDVRVAFWRYMPFSKEIKEKLRTRNYVYQELYQRDLNRAMSDGY
jgi:hypothetical protein